MRLLWRADLALALDLSAPDVDLDLSAPDVDLAVVVVVVVVVQWRSA